MARKSKHKHISELEEFAAKWESLLQEVATRLEKGALGHMIPVYVPRAVSEPKCSLVEVSSLEQIAMKFPTKLAQSCPNAWLDYISVSAFGDTKAKSIANAEKQAEDLHKKYKKANRYDCGSKTCNEEADTCRFDGFFVETLVKQMDKTSFENMPVKLWYCDGLYFSGCFCVKEM